MPVQNPLQFQTKAVTILYLDDQESDLNNFVNNARRYQGNANLNVRTTNDHTKAVQLIEDRREAIDVFVCDHNMPGLMGFKLIEYLKGSKPNILYVLYTGAANLDDNLKRACEKKQVLYFIKTEEFTTLIGQILRGLKKKEDIQDPPGELYEFIAQAVMDDLRRVQKIDPEFSIISEGRKYKVQEILSEIKQRSPFALEYLKNYFRGLKFFNNTTHDATR